jgi:hypothetical protein
MALAVSCAVLAGRCFAGEAYMVVKISEMDRTTDQQVMSATEFKELERVIQLERKLFPDAVRNAAKAWREDEFNKGTAFLGAMVVPRAIVGSPKRFPTQEKAEEQLNKDSELEGKKQARLLDRGGAKARKDERTLKKESDISRAAELVKEKLDELVAGKGAPAAPAAPAAGGKKADDKPAVNRDEALKAAAKAL